MEKIGLIIGVIWAASVAAQTINSNIDNQWPNSRYTPHGDGTVTDNQTGLMWAQCSVGKTFVAGQCTGNYLEADWHTALDIAANSSLAGFFDWQLPNIKQLGSLLARNRHEPSINIQVFAEFYELGRDRPQSQYWYWSASPYAEYNLDSWVVDFNSAEDSTMYRLHKARIRLVRSVK